jgi:zinc-binding alcohol dehydrogenase family protein
MTNIRRETRAIGYSANLPSDNARSLIDTSIAVQELREHDLLVRIQAVSVNPVDVKLRQQSDPDGQVRVLGFDGAGVVESVGSAVTLFKPGDEVFYAGAIDRPGTNSQLHVVDERIVGRKPSSLSFAEAAALPLTAITAWEGLFEKLRLTSESHGALLVVGATGGVGSMVVQLAHSLLPNVRVIATASRPEGERWVRRLGADDTVNHHEDLIAQFERTAPDGVDWIFTAQSTGQVGLYAELLRPNGQIVAIDDPAAIDVVPLKHKSLSWHWEFMFARSLHQTPDMISQHILLNEVARLADEGLIRSTATTVLQPLDAEHLRKAHGLVESGRVIGKVVVAHHE